uniref:SCP domain-containing protein n=1 Tax=Trichobilharzia regenti TaxID=157069 RepID=A0AA85J6N2_TRIRE|nr:unnamed protein product [Trichobilharzia regenti]
MPQLMVFANTTDIGCGVTKCPGINNIKNGLFIVCNYGPAANLNARPYEAKNINEVCPVKETAVGVQSEHAEWHLTMGTLKYDARKCYCFK